MSKLENKLILSNQQQQRLLLLSNHGIESDDLVHSLFCWQPNRNIRTRRRMYDWELEGEYDTTSLKECRRVNIWGIFLMKWKRKELLKEELELAQETMCQKKNIT